jgi:hypothetical protein
MTIILDPSGCGIGYATIAVHNLQCRATPDLQGAVIGVWPQGARVIVWAQRDDGWWYVGAEYGGTLGWSFADPEYVQEDASTP